MASFADVVLDESELENGYSAAEVFSNSECVGITFDDLIVLPGAIDFGVAEVDLHSRISRNYSLSCPLASSPMDTVTEQQMAIGMALNGGIGFIHANCTVEQQTSMVAKVKNFENGFIMEPAVLSPDNILSDLDELRKTRKIKGVPITIDGKVGTKLVGLISNRDSDFIDDRTKKISELMTPLDQLVTGRYPLSIMEANRILKESKKGYLPLIDNQGNLRALTTRTDIKKQEAYPNASKDRNGKLLVGAAVKAGCRDPLDIDRVHALYKAGCNIIILDALNGDCDRQVEYIKLIKEQFKEMDVIAGNVVRVSQAKFLLDAGADGLRIGMGTGSLDTTQLVKAVGRAQLSSIYACARVAHEQYNVPVIADGGLKNTGTIIKALAIGANVAMMGSLLAGVDESPGDYFYQNGTRLKQYRSHFAPTNSISCGNVSTTRGGDCMGNVVSGTVVDKGPLNRYIPYLNQSIRHGLQDMGTRSLCVMRQQLYSHTLRFEVRSPSAQKEGGVHDLHSFTQNLFA